MSFFPVLLKGVTLLLTLSSAHSNWCYGSKCINAGYTISCDLEFNHCVNNYPYRPRCVPGYNDFTSERKLCFISQTCGYNEYDGSPYCVDGDDPAEHYTFVVGPIVGAVILFMLLLCCVRRCCRRRANRGVVIQQAAPTTIIQNVTVAASKPESYQNPPVYPGQAGPGYPPQQMPGAYAYPPQQIPGQNGAGYPPQMTGQGGAGYPPQIPGQGGAGYPPQQMPGQGGAGYPPQQMPYPHDAPPNYNDIARPCGPTNEYSSNPYYKG